MTTAGMDKEKYTTTLGDMPELFERLIRESEDYTEEQMRDNALETAVLYEAEWRIYMHSGKITGADLPEAIKASWCAALWRVLAMRFGADVTNKELEQRIARVYMRLAGGPSEE